MAQDDNEILMHFVIPYDWKGTLRGLFWIFIFTLFFWSFLAYLAVITAGMNYVCLISGYLIMVAMYLLIRYVSVKYDKIKEPIRVWIKRDKFIFKKGGEVIGTFHNIKRAVATINDKFAKLETWYYYQDEKGDIGWIYILKRANVEKGKYKYYIEKYWIPSMKLILKQIKELNPNVEISWTDTRKKYR